MKTLKKNNDVVRVSEKDVERKIKDGYKYCPKSEWKKDHHKKKKDVDIKTEEK